MREPQRQQCQGQLALFEVMHPCPVCSIDRDAVGHHLTELAVPYSMADLLYHLGSPCGSDDRGIGHHDEWLEYEPFPAAWLA